MAGKVVKSSFVLLRKIILNRKESSSKSGTSHIRKTLPFIVGEYEAALQTLKG